MSKNYINLYNNNNVKNETIGSDIKNKLDDAQNNNHSIIVDSQSSLSKYVYVGNRNKYEDNIIKNNFINNDNDSNEIPYAKKSENTCINKIIERKTTKIPKLIIKNYIELNKQVNNILDIFDYIFNGKCIVELEEHIDYRELLNTPEGNNNSNLYYLEYTKNVNQDIQENISNKSRIFNKIDISNSEINKRDNMKYNTPDYTKVKTYHNVMQNIPDNKYNNASFIKQNHIKYSEINIKNNMNYISPNYTNVNNSQSQHGINYKNSGKDIHENEKEISSRLNKDIQKRVNCFNGNSKKENESIIFGKNNINNASENILSKISKNTNSILTKKKEDINQDNQSKLLKEEKIISLNYNYDLDSNKFVDNINMNKKAYEEVESIDIIDYNISLFGLSNEDYEDNEQNESLSEEPKNEKSNIYHNNRIDLEDKKKEQNLNNAYIKNTSKNHTYNLGINRIHFNIINSGKNSLNEIKLHNNISEVPEKYNSIHSNNPKNETYNEQKFDIHSIAKNNELVNKEKPDNVNIVSEEKINKKLIENFIIEKKLSVFGLPNSYINNFFDEILKNLYKENQDEFINKFSNFIMMKTVSKCNFCYKCLNELTLNNLFYYVNNKYSKSTKLFIATKDNIDNNNSLFYIFIAFSTPHSLSMLQVGAMEEILINETSVNQFKYVLKKEELIIDYSSNPKINIKDIFNKIHLEENSVDCNSFNKDNKNISTNYPNKTSIVNNLINSIFSDERKKKLYNCLNEKENRNYYKNNITKENFDGKKISEHNNIINNESTNNLLNSSKINNLKSNDITDQNILPNNAGSFKIKISRKLSKKKHKNIDKNPELDFDLKDFINESKKKLEININSEDDTELASGLNSPNKFTSKIKKMNDSIIINKKRNHYPMREEVEDTDDKIYKKKKLENTENYDDIDIEVISENSRYIEFDPSNDNNNNEKIDNNEVIYLSNEEKSANSIIGNSRLKQKNSYNDEY